MTGSRRFLALFLTFALSGCFSHRAVPVESVPVGARIRARLPDAEARRAAELLGEEREVVQGRFLGFEGSDVVLQLPTATALDGRALTQRLLVPSGALATVELRELDRARTFGLIGGVTVLGSILFVTQFAAAKSDDPSPDPGPINEIRIPLVRFGVGR